ncbi:MAG: cytochrome c oxidase subunit II [Candidatus Limnocylindrales bacterium]
MFSPRGVALRLTKSGRLRRTAGLMTLLGTVLFMLSACSGQVNEHPTGDDLSPGFGPGHIVTTQGQKGADLYPIILIISIIVFVLVEGLILLIAWRYRRRVGQTGLPTQTHGNNRLEALWIIIPAIVVTGLFVGTFTTLADTDRITTDQDVIVDVTGFQWQWTFAYPQHLNTTGRPLSFTGAGADGPELVLPTHEKILFNLHAQDVIHSFYVPQFFYKRDVIPGRTNQFEITIEDEGTYGGQCAEFCGLSHSQMYFTVRAVSSAEYDTWVAAELLKADATPEPKPSGAVTIPVDSVGIVEGFAVKELQAPPDTPIAFEFKNSDPAVQHNLGIRQGNPDGSDWVGQPPIEAGQSGTYQAPPLKAGTYEFYCAIHPNMVGTLTVGE